MALQPAVGFGLKPWLLKLWTNAKTRRFGKGRVGCMWILGPCLPPSYLAQNHTSLMESIYINPYRLPDEEVEAKSDPQIILCKHTCQVYPDVKGQRSSHNSHLSIEVDLSRFHRTWQHYKRTHCKI